MSDTLSRKVLLDCLKKEVGFCIEEKFNEKNTRFYLGRETVLTDIIEQIESGKFDSKTDYKAITELAVKGLKEITETCPSGAYEIKFIADTTLSEIERLTHEK